LNRIALINAALLEAARRLWLLLFLGGVPQGYCVGRSSKPAKGPSAGLTSTRSTRAAGGPSRAQASSASTASGVPSIIAENVQVVYA